MTKANQGNQNQEQGQCFQVQKCGQGGEKKEERENQVRRNWYRSKGDQTAATWAMKTVMVAAVVGLDQEGGMKVGKKMKNQGQDLDVDCPAKLKRSPLMKAWKDERKYLMMTFNFEMKYGVVEEEQQKMNQGSQEIWIEDGFGNLFNA